jgi:hypothetical protein
MLFGVVQACAAFSSISTMSQDDGRALSHLKDGVMRAGMQMQFNGCTCGSV